MEKEPSEKGILSFFCCWRRSEGQDRIAPNQKARVEPKSYFANERTYIQWISGGLLLMTVAAILYEYRDSQADYATAALVLLCGALVIVTYSSFVYFRRLRLLESGRPYGYVDKIGPMILSTFVIIGVSLLLFKKTQTVTELAAANHKKGIRPLSGSCLQSNLSGVSNLEYQPSDVVVDHDRGLLLVPSISDITSIRGGQVEVLAVSEGADFEGLTYAGDRIFAVSEGKKESKLIEFEWGAAGTLQEVNVWSIDTPNVEGITFAPDVDDSSGDGYLYVGGHVNPGLPDVRAVVDIYRLPGAQDESSSLPKAKSLNSNLLSEGLEDPKIGALTYFEGNLYVLHDNARLVRVWNKDTGDLVSNFVLPHVQGGFDQQWEGMALERGGIDGDRFLRGSPGIVSEPLTLHLALDTPPQVWSLSVHEGTKPGEIILPDCATS